MKKSLQDPDPEVRASVAFALGKIEIGSEGTVPALILTLKDPDWSVRGSAADALGRIGTGLEDAVPALIQALQDPDLWVRGIAKDVLKRIKIPAASEAINNFQQQNSGNFE